LSAQRLPISDGDFRRRSLWTLAGWLRFTAALGLVMGVMGATCEGWFAWQQEKVRAGSNFIAASRSIILSVDLEIDRAVAVARGLAVSRALAAGDYVTFDRQAREALGPYGYWLTLISAADNRQLVNTQLPPGTPPDVTASPTRITAENRNGAMSVRPVDQSRATGAWVVGVIVPVKDGGKVTHFMSVLIPAAGFQKIIEEQRLPKDWQAVVLDTDWRVVARLVDVEKFIGREGANRELLENHPDPDSVYDLPVLTGQRFLSARSRSHRYGWTAAVGMSEAGIFQAALVPIGLSALFAFFLVALVLGIVALLGRSLAASAARLAAAATALEKNEPIALPRFKVQELAQVGYSLQHAAERIREHADLLERRIEEKTQELRRESQIRQEAEAALAHAQRLDALGQLTGGIAHDFNNMLTVISANLELIEKHGGSDRIKQLAARARAGTSRGARLVSALLAFARKQPLRPELVDINKLIGEFHPVLKGALGDTIHLDLHLSAGLEPCRVDAAQFESALLNLITNAQAAMPRGGRVTIATTRFERGDTDTVPLLPAGRYARIVVTDTGLGMTPEQLAHVFEPFYTTKEVGKGTGLGLAQVYGFARQSGGDLQISSEVGAGTSLYIFLPMIQSDAGEKSLRSVQPPPAQAPGTETILLVDDDTEVRAALAEGLRNLGYHVLEAGDALEALRIIRTGEAIDVVVTDNLMPNGMIGRELARTIAKIDPHIRTILLSGDPFAGDAAGTNGFLLLQKPVLLHELTTAIRQQIGLPDQPSGWTSPRG
jgi:signal transduction histidine kinase